MILVFQTFHCVWVVHNLKRELSEFVIFRGLMHINETITPIRKFRSKLLDEQIVIIFTAEFS